MAEKCGFSGLEVIPLCNLPVDRGRNSNRRRAAGARGLPGRGAVHVVAGDARRGGRGPGPAGGGKVPADFPALYKGIARQLKLISPLQGGVPSKVGGGFSLWAFEKIVLSLKWFHNKGVTSLDF